MDSLDSVYMDKKIYEEIIYFILRGFIIKDKKLKK